MQGFLILAIIGTDKDTLEFSRCKMLMDGWTNRCTDECMEIDTSIPHLAISRCYKNWGLQGNTFCLFIFALKH